MNLDYYHLLYLDYSGVSKLNKEEHVDYNVPKPVVLVMSLCFESSKVDTK